MIVVQVTEQKIKEAIMKNLVEWLIRLVFRIRVKVEYDTED